MRCIELCDELAGSEERSTPLIDMVDARVDARNTIVTWTTSVCFGTLRLKTAISSCAFAYTSLLTASSLGNSTRASSLPHHWATEREPPHCLITAQRDLSASQSHELQPPRRFPRRLAAGSRSQGVITRVPIALRRRGAGAARNPRAPRQARGVLVGLPLGHSQVHELPPDPMVASRTPAAPLLARGRCATVPAVPKRDGAGMGAARGAGVSGRGRELLERHALCRHRRRSSLCVQPEAPQLDPKELHCCFGVRDVLLGRFELRRLCPAGSVSIASFAMSEPRKVTCSGKERGVAVVGLPVFKRKQQPGKAIRGMLT